MPLFMPGKSEAWDAARNAIAFPAEDAAAGTSIECLISADALAGHFGAVVGDVPSLLDAFRRYRPAIERAASEKFDQVGDPPVLLTVSDFNGARQSDP